MLHDNISYCNLLYLYIESEHKQLVFVFDKSLFFDFVLVYDK